MAFLQYKKPPVGCSYFTLIKVMQSDTMKQFLKFLHQPTKTDQKSDHTQITFNVAHYNWLFIMQLHFILQFLFKMWCHKNFRNHCSSSCQRSRHIMHKFLLIHLGLRYIVSLWHVGILYNWLYQIICVILPVLMLYLVKTACSKPRAILIII